MGIPGAVRRQHRGRLERHWLALLWAVSQAGKEKANPGMTEETSRHVPRVWHGQGMDTENSSDGDAGRLMGLKVGAH